MRGRGGEAPVGPGCDWLRLEWIGRTKASPYKNVRLRKTRLQTQTEVESEVDELGPVDGTTVGVDGENAADVFGGLGVRYFIDEADLVAGESALHTKTIAF
jgi:hypothetical protein